MYTFQDTFHTHHLPKHLYVWPNTAFSRIYWHYFRMPWSRGHAILVLPLLEIKSCSKWAKTSLQTISNPQELWRKKLLEYTQRFCGCGQSNISKCVGISQKVHVFTQSKHKLSQLIYPITMIFSMKEYGALSMFKPLLHISLHFTVI